MKKSYRLYNVMFPIWLLVWYPTKWLVVIPVNVIWDYLVCRMSQKLQKGFSKKILPKVVGIGFLSDFVGALLMYGLSVAIQEDIFWNPFQSVSGAVSVIVCTLVSAISIYLLNFNMLKKTEVENPKKMAVLLAILTAPYLFLIPTSWIYGGGY